MVATLHQAWGADALGRRLAQLVPGLRVEVAASVDSTNSVLLERVRSGDDGPRLLVAEMQTAGRGRQGRRWQSAPGASLTFSIALPLAATDWSGLSLAVGLALAEAIDPAEGGRAPRIGLKWPNDLLIRADGGDALPRKLGGILIESLAGGARRIAVVGIGVNIAPLALDGLSLGYGCVDELHRGVAAPEVLAWVAPAVLAALREFDEHGFAPLRQRYARRDWLAGRTVTTSLAECPQGVADGVGDDGALWLRIDGARQRVASGEVSVRAWTTEAHGSGDGAAPC